MADRFALPFRDRLGGDAADQEAAGRAIDRHLQRAGAHEGLDDGEAIHVEHERGGDRRERERDILARDRLAGILDVADVAPVIEAHEHLDRIGGQPCFTRDGGAQEGSGAGRVFFPLNGVEVEVDHDGSQSPPVGPSQQ